MGMLDDKVAVITGSGRGIGKEIALLMAREGAKVVVNDPGGSEKGEGEDAKVADEVVEEIKKLGGEAAANYESVASWEGGQKIVQTALDSFGRIDILVNNAGILRDRILFKMSEEEWDGVVKTHLYGSFYCSRAVAPPSWSSMARGAWLRSKVAANPNTRSWAMGGPISTKRLRGSRMRARSSFSARARMCWSMAYSRSLRALRRRTAKKTSIIRNKAAALPSTTAHTSPARNRVWRMATK